ncbi:MAG: hypothetical protein AMXMBFR36_25980 [Acidobacteriota bacterium]
MQYLRVLRSLAVGAVAAALATLVLWFFALLTSGDKLATDAAGLEAVWGFLALAGLVFVVALVVAFAAEAFAALPLFLLFRRLGRLTVVHYLLGGLFASAAAYAAIKGIKLPPRPFVVFAYFLPGLVGALAFRHVIGWSSNTSLERTSGPAARSPLSS